MKIHTPFPLCVVVTLLLISCVHCTRIDNSPSSKQQAWKWLPKQLADTALLLPGIISDTGRTEMSVTFTPDGDTAYFSVLGRRVEGRNMWVMMETHFNGTQWSKPDTVSFSGIYSDYGGSLSPDGQVLYFSSRRPIRENDTAKKADYDLWMAQRSNNAWNKPQRLADGINSYKQEYSVAVGNTNLYICADRKDSIGGSDLYVVPRSDVQNPFAPVKNIGSPPNTIMWEGQASIDPQETRLLFNYIADGEGQSEDIFICYKRDGIWTLPKKLNNIVNTNANEFMHCVSPDGKYCFFGRNGNIYIANLEAALERLRNNDAQ